MVKWTAVFLATEGFQCHNLFTWWRGQVGAIAILCISKFTCFRGYSLCNMPKYVDFSVIELQSDSPALGV